MKFAKLLEETRAIADASWKDAWIDYKGLKKLIGSLPPTVKDVAARTADPAAVMRALSSIPEEVAFFTRLRHEVAKLSSFFVAQQARCAAQVEGVRRVHDDLHHLDRISEAQAVPALKRVISCFSAILELENFAVMNYAGCGKILKKHDKVTTFTTKAQYMAKVVDTQEWAAYPRLLSMLAMVDHVYSEVLAKAGADTRSLVLGSYEQSRLASLNTMKRAASSEKLAVLGRAPGLDAVVAAAAVTSGPGAPSSSSVVAAAAAHSRMASDPSDSDDEDDAPSSSSSSSSTAAAADAADGAAAGMDVSAADRRQTELDIAAFIAGVGSAAMPAAASSSSAAYSQAATPSAPVPAAASHQHVALAVAAAGLPAGAVPIVAHACSALPGLAPEFAAHALRQQPHVAADGAMALAHLAAAMQDATRAQVAAARGGVAMMPFSAHA